ncbi:DsbA family protein [Flavobacterium sp. M31R6]|uniref:DsbA family oxidoreductase n=1 Tax=Flavobacterium sp. M31R6 TaxID=2739062 RepID=UPI0015692837|nr:DsbA family oxidoreductase [Flavobacterium sp. M31R6]QKJ62227.1 DsbA family oxidoreductase [Flavobacterium sp. M31R6]
MENQLKIQIWSDVMCPFCYIGKRKIEEALNQFENKNSVAIEWKSFQLDPSFVATPNESIVDHLAEKYRKNSDWAQTMIDNMTENAKKSGLDFHFEKAILANSLNAHRLLHLAKKHNLSNELEELLFKAYLTDGKDVNDLKTLESLGLEVGLEKEAIENVLNTDLYANEVRQDQEEAQAIGVTGVPFFVFDNKYAVSGAQPTDVFLKTLEKTWEEGNFDTKLKLQNTNGENSCGIDGCE